MNMGPIEWLYQMYGGQNATGGQTRGGATSDSPMYGTGAIPGGLGRFQPGGPTTGTMGMAPAAGGKQRGGSSSDTLMSGYSGPKGLSRFKNGGQTAGGTMETGPISSLYGGQR